MKSRKTIGVVLLNLGGPEHPEEVRPFLYNLFSDRQIIRLGPSFLQKPIAWAIARRRAPKSTANYAMIGGGSPIRKTTEEQARVLDQMLQDDGRFVVRPCMRYWHPFALETLHELSQLGVEEIVALPLYPHYSKATTGSSLFDLHRALKKLNLNIPVRTVSSWPAEPLFIACLADRIRAGVQSFHGAEVQVVYSAHSLPVQFIREGDPYVEHLQESIVAVETHTGIKGHLCYQSRSGPVEWLGPSLPDMLTTLAGDGCTNVLVVPISFVSDHIETLYEIDIQYRRIAEELGMGFAMTEALNADPRFISGLRNLVLTGLRE
ncbi:MAG: ferrochelatase [Desulfobulbus sp.]|nr:ferrochelatase [Desulfobulbus sp.]